MRPSLHKPRVCYKTAVPELPSSVTVAIIGGGFAGAATAWALRRVGITDVIILEREVALGRFASGRSAGLGRQLAEDDHTTALTVRGAALLRQLPGVWTPTGGIPASTIRRRPRRTSRARGGLAWRSNQAIAPRCSRGGRSAT
jgi:glycine/D-amino acid oxidase-like deaminating enzyme